MNGPATHVNGARLIGWRAAAVWIVVAIDALLIVGASALTAEAAGNALVVAMVPLASVASFGIIGAIVVVRLPRNPIGWILWGSAAVFAASIVANAYVTHTVPTSGPAPAATVVAAILTSVAPFLAIGAVGVFLPLLFPDGHLPSPRWRWVARLSVAAVAAATALDIVKPGPMAGTIDLQNPLGLSGPAGMGDAIGWLMGAIMAGPLVLAAGSVAWRFRHGSPVVRQQVKWFAGAVGLTFAAMFIGTADILASPEVDTAVLLAGLAFLPVAIGIAILRYRLYDIDRIVSRAIGYLIVTGVLAGVFVGAVLAFRAILEPVTGTSPAAVAASTLVVAALFQPLRRRVQRVVDRRFDRARYDAERTVADFAERLRDEVDLGTVTRDLVAITGATLAPDRVGLWIRASRGAP